MISRSTASFLLFLIGAFSRTQIRLGGSLGVSELFVFLAAPFVFVHDYKQLQRDGFVPILVLCFLTMLGCVVSTVYNHLPAMYFIKGFASPYAIFALIVILHKLLRANIDGLKWLMLGLAVTVVLSTFILQPTTEIEKYAQGEGGIKATAAVMTSPIFWIGRLKPWVMLPVTGWYFKTPMLYLCFASIAFAVFAMFSTESGRAVALSMLFTTIVLLVGRKKICYMNIIKQKFWFFVVAALIIAPMINMTYKYAATSGVLGEKAEEKYRHQSESGDSILAILMKGRVNFFACMYVGCKRPIVGYGPWAPDYDGVTGEFIYKYGSQQEFLEYCNMISNGVFPWLGGHSQIGTFWVWYGIFGLLLVLYILLLILSHLKNRMSTIPQWYGFFAVSIPGIVWGIFFSPFSFRVEEAVLIVACLLVRCVDRGKIQLPYVMQIEIDRYAR